MVRVTGAAAGAALPEVVVTERQRLQLWTAADVADLLAARRRPEWHADFPRPDDRDAATLWRAGDPWSPRHIVRGTTVLGSIGFFGPPDDVDGVLEVEVGFGLVPEARGWGFASESLGALVAGADAVGVRVRASVQPDNAPSLRVLATCGFTALRGSDEDGGLVMVRPLPVR